MGVAKTNARQMFLEPGLKGTFRFADVQHATLVASDHIYNIAQLAIEGFVYSECGARSLHLPLMVQERARSTSGLTAGVGSRTRARGSCGVTSESGTDQSVPEVMHPFICHKRR